MKEEPKEEPLDIIYVNVSIHFGWYDRIKILLGKGVRINTMIKCWQNKVGGLDTVSSTRTAVDGRLFPRFRQTHPGGYSVEEDTHGL